MTRAKNVRWGAAIAAIAIALLTVPAIGASGPGAIALQLPGTFTRDAVPVQWTYSTGTVVKPSSSVDVLTSDDHVNWRTIARVPISAGGYNWDTSQLADAIYVLKLRVAGSSTYSKMDFAYVDNTAPTIQITRPSRSEILVDDTAVASLDAVVAGRTTLQAYATDALSGIDSIVWTLDDEEIGSGPSMVYDFTLAPGHHELSAIATDAAGNVSASTINVVALPGQSAADFEQPEPPQPEIPEIPQPDPSATPTLPPLDLPTLPPIPSPDPSVLPSPDPSVTPTSTPTALPLPTLPPLP